jgi:Protein of unknown function (DUF2490)
MIRVSKTLCIWASLVCSVCLPTRAQDVQFLPEIDAYAKLNSAVRLNLEAKDDRDGGERTQFTFGPSVQFYLKPLVSLKKVTVFDLDDSKSRVLVMEVGYRYITAPSTEPKNRLILAATSNLPMKADISLTDRNRADLDWKSGQFTWRYRNKLTVDRTFAIDSYHVIPYAAAELFYESQYNKISTTSLYAGGLFPVGKHVEFNLYYQHDNNTGNRPNKQQSSVGLALSLFFSREQK